MPPASGLPYRFRAPTGLEDWYKERPARLVGPYRPPDTRRHPVTPVLTDVQSGPRLRYVRFSISRRTRDAHSYGITTADGSHLDDIAKRQRQYTATMVFRIAAVLTLIFVPGLSVMLRVILGLVATVIPYFAVVRANGGPENSAMPTNLMIGGPRQGELPNPDLGLPGARRIDDEESPAGGGQAGEGEDCPADTEDPAT
jgi:hypothetical protein